MLARRGVEEDPRTREQQDGEEDSYWMWLENTEKSMEEALTRARNRKTR